MGRPVVVFLLLAVAIVDFSRGECLDVMSKVHCGLQTVSVSTEIILRGFVVTEFDHR